MTELLSESEEFEVDLRVGILTNQYPSKRNPDRGTFIRDLAYHLRCEGIYVTVIEHERNFAAMSLESLVRSANLDVLDAQFVAPAGVIAALTPRFCPFVITVHRWDIIEFPYRWPMARIATIVALRRARGIIAVSDTIRSEIMRFVRPNPNIATIPNAVDTQRFRPDLRSGFLKRQLDIPETNRVILSLGHLIPRKGFESLLLAMPAILKWSDSCSLVIVGEGPQRAQLEALSYRLGLDGRLKLPGRVGETLLPYFYAMADVFVMPSVSEGHCVSILEAMSAAKPIVASAIPGIAESVLGDHNGFLVPPGDPGELSSAIQRILQSDQTRERFGRNSRERAIRKFDWKLRVHRLEDFYLSILQ